MGNLDKVDIDITFREEPLSRRAEGIMWLLHFTVMYMAFVLSRPSRGISSSVKAIKMPGVIFLMSCLDSKVDTWQPLCVLEMGSIS